MTKPVTWTPSVQDALDRIRGEVFATTTEASAVLRYDWRTLRKGIDGGTIPAVRAGSTFRIPVSWILAQAGLNADGGVSA